MSAITKAIQRDLDKKRAKFNAWCARNQSLIAANLMIAQFAIWDGWTVTFPTQEELDALWQYEENTSL